MLSFRNSLLGIIFWLSVSTLWAQQLYIADTLPLEPEAPLKRAVGRSEQIIRKLLRENTIPGIAITVTKKGETIWQQGYGYADIEQKIPVDPQKTLFRIASLSKPISATGLAKMVADSLINLDTSLYQYVPYFPKKKYDFTIRQLGGHLAGIRNYAGNEFLNNKPMTIKEGISFFENDSLYFEPGTRYLYSSYNWNLIPLAMEEASRMPFEVYIREKVLLPLQMYHTMADVSDSIPGKTVCYTQIEKKAFRLAAPVHNYYKLGGGGYLSTSEDMAKLGNAYLTPGFLPEALVNQFLSSQTTKNGEPTHYGIGWQVSFDAQNRPYFGHKGSGVGGYAFFYIYPVQQIVIVMLLNVTDPKVDDDLNTIIDYLLAVEGN